MIFIIYMFRKLQSIKRFQCFGVVSKHLIHVSTTLNIVKNIIEMNLFFFQSKHQIFITSIYNKQIYIYISSLIKKVVA